MASFNFKRSHLRFEVLVPLLTAVVVSVAFLVGVTVATATIAFVRAIFEKLLAFGQVLLF